MKFYAMKINIIVLIKLKIKIFLLSDIYFFVIQNLNIIYEWWKSYGLM